MFAFCCHLLIFLMKHLLYIFILLNQHDDVESDSGPVKNKLKNISCYHWNVDSLEADHVSSL